MLRESLPLLIALSLPLVGAAGLLPVGESGTAAPALVTAPLGRGDLNPVVLPPPAQPAAPLPAAGVWLRF